MHDLTASFNIGINDPSPDKPAPLPSEQEALSNYQLSWLAGFPGELHDELRALLQQVKTDKSASLDNTDINSLSERTKRLKLLKLAIDDPVKFTSLIKVKEALKLKGTFTRTEKLKSLLGDKPFFDLSDPPKELKKLLCGSQGIKSPNLKLAATTSRLLKRGKG